MSHHAQSFCYFVLVNLFRMIRSYLLLQQYFEISANEHLVCTSLHFRCFRATFSLSPTCIEL